MPLWRRCRTFLSSLPRGNSFSRWGNEPLPETTRSLGGGRRSLRDRDLFSLHGKRLRRSLDQLLADRRPFGAKFVAIPQLRERLAGRGEIFAVDQHQLVATAATTPRIIEQLHHPHVHHLRRNDVAGALENRGDMFAVGAGARRRIRRRWPATQPRGRAP